MAKEKTADKPDKKDAPKSTNARPGVKTAIGIAGCIIALLMIASYSDKGKFSSFSDPGSPNDRRIPVETTYPTESSPAEILVGTETMDVPIVVPHGMKIVFQSGNNETFKYRDKNWENGKWIPVTPGHTVVNERVKYPEIVSCMGKRIYVSYYLKSW